MCREYNNARDTIELCAHVIELWFSPKQITRARISITFFFVCSHNSIMCSLQNYVETQSNHVLTHCDSVLATLIVRNAFGRTVRVDLRRGREMQYIK